MHRILLPLLLLAGCADDRVATVAALTPDAANGATVYADNCASCHGADGTGGGAYPDLTEEAEEHEEIIAIVIDGEDEMPAFGETLSDQEIADVAEHVHGLSGGHDE